MSDWIRQLWRPAAGSLACVVIGWIAFLGDGWVPMLSNVDLGFHELGHLIFAPFPHVITVLAGSVTQVAVPLGLGAYFIIKRRDLVAAGLMAGWAGTSMKGAAIYIADAPVRLLPLLGGQGAHDWAYLLGRWNAMDQAESIASAVTWLGVTTVIAGIALCWARPVGRWWKTEQAERRRRAFAGLPVRRTRPPL